MTAGCPFLPWLLIMGEYGAPVLAPCEMTGLTQRAQLSTQMLTSPSVLIFRQNNKSQKLNKHLHGILVNIQSILNVDQWYTSDTLIKDIMHITYIIAHII